MQWTAKPIASKQVLTSKARLPQGGLCFGFLLGPWVILPPEPIQHMFDFSAISENGKALKWKRVDVDGIPSASHQVRIQSRFVISLAKELTVRSNHLTRPTSLDAPFTWFWPERGLSLERLAQDHKVTLVAPDHWSPATQLRQEGEELNNDGTRTWTMAATGRDLLLDSIIEINPNPTITHVWTAAHTT